MSYLVGICNKTNYWTADLRGWISACANHYEKNGRNIVLVTFDHSKMEHYTARFKGQVHDGKILLDRPAKLREPEPLEVLSYGRIPAVVQCEDLKTAFAQLFGGWRRQEWEAPILRYVDGRKKESAKNREDAAAESKNYYRLRELVRLRGSAEQNRWFLASYARNSALLAHELDREVSGESRSREEEQIRKLEELAESYRRAAERNQAEADRLRRSLNERLDAAKDSILRRIQEHFAAREKAEADLLVQDEQWNEQYDNLWESQFEKGAP